MHDPNLEPLAQERPVAPAPRAVLGQLAAQRRDVVASVVVDHQQSAAGPQQPASLPDLIERAVPERRPVTRRRHRPSRGGASKRRRSVRFDERDAGPEIGELSSADPTGAIDEDHVPVPDRTEAVERPRELALDIQGPAESLGEPGLKVERKICHESRV